MIEIINFHEMRKIDDQSGRFVSTVSRATGWQRNLSPFILGPCQMWGGHEATNVENAWQFSKVYPEHLESDGSVGQKWLDWAKAGWADPIPRRYPMGKGVKPMYSWWDGKQLTYVQARKAIYIPLYQLGILHSGVFNRIVDEAAMAEADGVNLYLIDFDAYRHKQLGMSYRDVVECESRKQGHAFVLGMMLEDQYVLDEIVDEGMELRGG